MSPVLGITWINVLQLEMQALSRFFWNLINVVVHKDLFIFLGMGFVRLLWPWIHISRISIHSLRFTARALPSAVPRVARWGWGPTSTLCDLCSIGDYLAVLFYSWVGISVARDVRWIQLQFDAHRAERHCPLSVDSGCWSGHVSCVSKLPRPHPKPPSIVA